METINNDILSDGFRLEGSWASDLKDALKKMNESTTILEIDSSELIMYSIIDMQEDNFVLARLCPDEINNEMFFPTTRQKEYLKREGNYGKLPIKSLKNKGLTSELIRDIYENGFFFQIKVNKRCITLVPSKLFLSTLCNQMECGKMQIGRNIFRDLYLCSLLQNNGPFKIIYRTDNKYAGRLLGATSCRFLITPEDAVQSIWDELKKHDNDNFRIYFYSITHMKTVINFMKASEITICGHKFHFGCRFSFSDIARGSYSLESTIIYGGAIIPLDDVSLKKHVGKFLVKDFVEDYCKKNIINIIVDPNAIGGSEFAGYCGAAIAYRFAKTLIPKNKKLLEQLLALTAIATITDVMPLYGDNRNIVKRGLKLLNQRKVPYGMNVLLNLLRIEYIQEDDIGFKIGPVLNAAGRLEDNGAEKVFNLLKMKEPDNPMLENDQKAYTAALELIELNKKRQNIVKESMNKIQENYPDDVLANERCIVLYDSSFNEGIIGILAGKLTEKYNVPAFVFTDPIYPKKIGLYKGSGRSARNIHLKNLLDKNKDLLSGYGGHAGAAGLSIDKTKLSQFSQQVNLQLSDIVLSERRCLKYDLEISASEIPYYMDELQKFAPYGEGNPNPVFLIHDFYLSPRNGHFFQRIGQNAEHIKLYGNNMDAIGFDMAERFINNEVPKQIDIIGTLSFNYFNNRKKIQIEIFDYLSIKKEKTPFIESLESLLTL